MAARKRDWTPDIVREKIRTSMLINRLQNHVLGRLEMSPTQMRAAEVLLRKTIPDLSATELSGEIGTRDISDKPISPEEWAATYSLEAAARSPEGSH